MGHARGRWRPQLRRDVVAQGVDRTGHAVAPKGNALHSQGGLDPRQASQDRGWVLITQVPNAKRFATQGPQSTRKSHLEPLTRHLAQRINVGARRHGHGEYLGRQIHAFERPMRRLPDRGRAGEIHGKEVFLVRIDVPGLGAGRASKEQSHRGRNKTRGCGMLRGLMALLLMVPLMALGNDIAIANNAMMGITILTNEPCTYNKGIFAAYAYKQNKEYVYACWKLDGDNVIFSDSYPVLPSIPVKNFIKPPKLNDPR